MVPASVHLSFNLSAVQLFERIDGSVAEHIVNEQQLKTALKIWVHRWPGKRLHPPKSYENSAERRL